MGLTSSAGRQILDRVVGDKGFCLVGDVSFLGPSRSTTPDQYTGDKEDDSQVPPSGKGGVLVYSELLLALSLCIFSDL